MKNSKYFFERDYLELGYSGSGEPQDVLFDVCTFLDFFFFARYLFCIALLLFSERTDF